MAELEITRTEHYRDESPVKVQVVDRNGAAVDLTGASMVVTFEDVAGTAFSVNGVTTGNTWDAVATGKFHCCPGTTQTGHLVESKGVDHGWFQVQVTFSDGAIRYTDKGTLEVEEPVT